MQNQKADYDKLIQQYAEHKFTKNDIKSFDVSYLLSVISEDFEEGLPCMNSESPIGKIKLVK
ncbi:hypothetical protein DR996_27835 [Vibrio owensii]|nr:hypothetical protein DR996_27835 [Vibrio owensii]